MKKYNHLFVLFLLVLNSSYSQDSYKEFKKENKKFSEASISLPAFVINMFIDEDELDPYSNLLKKVRHYNVLVIPSENKKTVKRNLSKFLKKSYFEKYIDIKDKGDKVSLYFYEKKDKIKEGIIVVDSGSDFVLIHLKMNLKIVEFEEALSAAIVSN